jgi:DNA topoisomerase-1
MFKKSGRGYRKPFCINEACSNFVPEEKRGYKKKAKTDATEPEKQENNTEKEKGTQGKNKKAQKGTDK